MPIIKYITLILLLSLPLSARAEVIFYAIANKSSLKPGDRLQVTYNINTDVSEFIAPDFKPLLILKGPDLAKSSDGVSYTYILKAVRPGDVFISPAKVKANGITYKSNPILVTVEGALQSEAKAESKPITIDSQAEEILRAYLYIKPEIENKTYYVGENVKLQYYLYVHNDIVLASIEEPVPPAFESWWVEEEPLPELKYEYEYIGGVQFRKALLRSYVLNALKPGTFYLPQFRLDVDAAIEYSLDFDSDEKYYRKKVKLQSDKLTIIIEPIPNDNDFSGAVGEFDIFAFLDKESVELGEIFNLKIVIQGEGNFKHFSFGNIILPDGFREVGSRKVYDSLEMRNGIRGKKTIELSISAEKEGEFLIGQASFSYFSTSQEKIITKTSQPKTISVFPKGQIENSGTNVTISGEAMKTIAIIALGLSSLLIFYLLIIKLKKKKQVSATPVNINIDKKNIDIISQIRSIPINDKNEFLSELYETTYGYIGKQLKIEEANPNFEVFLQAMRDNSIDKNIISQFENISEKINRLRFSQNADFFDENRLKEEIISFLENFINYKTR